MQVADFIFVSARILRGNQSPGDWLSEVGPDHDSGWQMIRAVQILATDRGNFLEIPAYARPPTEKAQGREYVKCWVLFTESGPGGEPGYFAMRHKSVYKAVKGAEIGIPQIKDTTWERIEPGIWRGMAKALVLAE